MEAGRTVGPLRGRAVLPPLPAVRSPRTMAPMNRPPQIHPTPSRGTAVLVGALFLISTATFIVSNALITPLLGAHDFLAAVAGHSQLVIAATLIALIEGTATVGVAIALYPILRR